MYFGKNLRYLRKEHSLSQEDIALMAFQTFQGVTTYSHLLSVVAVGG